MVNQAHEDDVNSRIAGDTTGTPRWVKVFGIIALVVIVVFVLLMFTRGPGGHGHTPSRHLGCQTR